MYVNNYVEVPNAFNVKCITELHIHCYRKLFCMHDMEVCASFPYWAFSSPPYLPIGKTCT